MRATHTRGCGSGDRGCARPTVPGDRQRQARESVPRTLQRVHRTLELSCEAPIVPGFVSFNSLFDGVVAPAPPCLAEPDSLGHKARPMVTPAGGRVPLCLTDNGDFVLPTPCLSRQMNRQAPRRIARRFSSLARPACPECLLGLGVRCSAGGAGLRTRRDADT